MSNITVTETGFPPNGTSTDDNDADGGGFQIEGFGITLIVSAIFGTLFWLIFYFGRLKWKWFYQPKTTLFYK